CFVHCFPVAFSRDARFSSWESLKLRMKISLLLVLSAYLVSNERARARAGRRHCGRAEFDVVILRRAHCCVAVSNVKADIGALKAPTGCKLGAPTHEHVGENVSILVEECFCFNAHPQYLALPFFPSSWPLPSSHLTFFNAASFLTSPVV